MATQADLDALKKARDSGILTVEYDSQGRVTYRDIDDLRKAINDVENELAVASGLQPVTQSLTTFSRG